MGAAHRVAKCVEVREQLGAQELLDLADDVVHDDLRREVALSLVHDLHVRLDERADRLHLPLHLRVHRHLDLALLRARTSAPVQTNAMYAAQQSEYIIVFGAIAVFV